MAREPKTFSSKAERQKYEAAKARRRERRHERKTVAMASKAAEGTADFQALVEAEKIRIENQNGQTPVVSKAGRVPKAITTARDNLTKAFDLMGGVAALVVWGRDNPTEFYRLWARLIPKESVEVSATLPLEALLEKLSGHESMTVGEAAFQVGADLLEEGRRRAAEEDAKVIDGEYAEVGED